MLTIVASMKFIRSELISGNQQPSERFVMNPYDMFMVESLLALKKKTHYRIIGVTMGPMECLESMSKFIAMGMDDIYLISDKAFIGSDTYSSSYILSRALKHIEKGDIYAFGEKSIDGETSQVPIGVSSHLDLLCYTGVEKIEVQDDNMIYLRRVQGELMEMIEVPIPVAFCFRGFTTSEPDVSLIQLKKSRNYVPIILDAASLEIDHQFCGQSGSKTKVCKITNIASKRCAESVEGSLQVKVEVFKKLISIGGINN